MARLSLSTLLAPALCIACSLPAGAWAQDAYARVLEATPIYQAVNVPQQDCTEGLAQTRCQISSHTIEQIVGFDVRYEYQGQQYTQRMAQNPGARVRVQTTKPAKSHHSHAGTDSVTVVPGQQSYRSSMPGAPVVESIQYPSKDAGLPVHIDLHPGRPPRP